MRSKDFNEGQIFINHNNIPKRIFSVGLDKIMYHEIIRDDCVYCGVSSISSFLSYVNRSCGGNPVDEKANPEIHKRVKIEIEKDHDRRKKEFLDLHKTLATLIKQ